MNAYKQSVGKVLQEDGIKWQANKALKKSRTC